MKQRLLKISLPDDVRLYSSVLREMVAKDSSLSAEFFHYKKDEGSSVSRPANGQPVIRFIGGKTWVGMISTGDGDLPEQLFNSGLPHVIQAAFSATKKPNKIQINDLSMHVCDHHNPSQWFVREMVVKRRTKNARTEDLTALYENRLRKSILRQSEELGVDLDDDFPLAVTEVIRPRGLRLVTSTGPTNEYAELADIRFSTSLDFKGMWFAGNLTARGYGRIIRDPEQYSDKKEAV